MVDFDIHCNWMIHTHKHIIPSLPPYYRLNRKQMEGTKHAHSKTKWNLSHSERTRNETSNKMKLVLKPNRNCFAKWMSQCIHIHTPDTQLEHPLLENQLLSYIMLRYIAFPNSTPNWEWTKPATIDTHHGHFLPTCKSAKNNPFCVNAVHLLVESISLSPSQKRCIAENCIPKIRRSESTAPSFHLVRSSFVLSC